MTMAIYVNTNVYASSKYRNVLYFSFRKQSTFKVILHQFWMKKKFSLKIQYWNTAVPLLSYSCMFKVEICSQQLEICKSVCMFTALAIVVETD